jgi:hypothetical protein
MDMEKVKTEWFHMDWYDWGTNSSVGPHWSLVLVMYKLWSLIRDEVIEFHIVIILYLNKTNILMESFGHVFNL